MCMHSTIERAGHIEPNQVLKRGCRRAGRVSSRSAEPGDAGMQTDAQRRTCRRAGRVSSRSAEPGDAGEGSARSGENAPVARWSELESQHQEQGRRRVRAKPDHQPAVGALSPRFLDLPATFLPRPSQRGPRTVDGPARAIALRRDSSRATTMVISSGISAASLATRPVATVVGEQVRR
jgi:hypothetical protein